MSAKSEDIRLSINDVRYKKGDGTLYLMAERLGWMPNTKNNFTISHKYSDIKMQKISPEGKAKIQLQIVLHTGDTTTYQFKNLEDRTAVKDALIQILPQFKGKMPKDRERKALLLSKNPNLLQLYKDLVESKIVSADDFWSQFVDDRASDADTDVESQDVGVSANFLSGIPMNGKQIKGTVSVETLWAILKTYPKVARKHRELVPTKMSETEFWNKFFQSRYFNRDRSKDVFSDCARSDEKEWNSSLKSGIVDPFLDLDMFDDNAYKTSTDDPPASSSHDNSDQLLIKRFNQQSIRLLESLKAKEKSATNTTQDDEMRGDQEQDKSETTEVQAMSTQSSEADKQSTTNTSFRAHRRDWTYDDLAGHENTGDYLDDQTKVGSKMNQVDRDKYTVIPGGPNTIISQSNVDEHVAALLNWEPKLAECISPKDATEAMNNLSPAGFLMRSTQSNRLEDTVAEDLQMKLRSVYLASNELLRHFWMCFPAVEPSLEAKLIKLHETLKKFESTKLMSFQDSLSRDQRHLLNHILRVQFKAASRKFDSWKNKKRQRERQ